MNTLPKSLILLLLTAIVCACGNSSTRTVDSDTTTAEPVELTRLDRVLADYGTADSATRAATLESHHALLAALDSAAAWGVNLSDEVLTEKSEAARNSMFDAAVTHEFGTGELPESAALSQVINAIKVHGIDISVTQYATVVWNNRRSIAVEDSVLLVALNHYLGPTHEAYEGWPEHVRAEKDRRYLVCDITEAVLSASHPYSAANESVYSRLLYDGALTYLKSVLVPGATAALSTGFGDAQFDDIESHRAYVWHRLSADNGTMLYSTDRRIIDGLFSPRSASTLLSADAPGRAIRVTGYDIVKSYVENHPDMPLKRLLTPEFYDNQNTLVEAKYSM
jgi:hypothetical protein